MFSEKDKVIIKEMMCEIADTSPWVVAEVLAHHLMYHGVDSDNTSVAGLKVVLEDVAEWGDIIKVFEFKGNYFKLTIITDSLDKGQVSSATLLPVTKSTKTIDVYE